MDITAEGIPVRELNRHELGEALFTHLKERYDAKEQIIGAPPMRYHERMIMLSVLDGLWKDHLLAMDQLKEGIGLRGYGQQDPLISYKRESFEAFEAMMNRFQEDTVRFLFRMQIMGPDGKEISIPARVHPQSIVFSGGSSNAAEPGAAALPGAVGGSNGAGIEWRIVERSGVVDSCAYARAFDHHRFAGRGISGRKKRELQQARMAGAGEATETAQRRTGEKVGRNDPCPCGSGKKFKKCHGVDA